MPRSSSGPGVAGIIAGVVGVGLLMSVMYGNMMQWLPIALFILVSLRAVHRVNR